MGLKINASRTMVMQSLRLFKVNMCLESVDMEEVDSCVYLGQEANMRHNL